MQIKLLERFFALPPEQQALWGAVVLLPLLVNLLAIRHALTREFPSPKEKLLWLGVGAFLPFLAGLPYWLIGRRRGRVPAPRGQ